MIFKNMVAYRLPNGWNLNNNKLENSLFKLRDRSCGSIEKSACGWESPFGNQMVHSVHGHRYIKMRVEEKVLPSSVIKKELKFRCSVIKQQQGRDPGRKEIKEIKEAIEMELLPKAFVKERYVPIWIDQKGEWIGIDASSRKKADEAITMLVSCVDDLPMIQPINTTESPTSLMRTWLSNEEASNGFSIDDECELIGQGDVQSSVKYAKHALNGQDVHQHLDEGKLPISLGVSYEDKIAFVFNEGLELKKIELIGFNEESGSEDRQELFDGMFLCQVEVLSQALKSLVLACGGESEFGIDEEEGQVDND
jgi:recombination associated protein RdgC